jgi:tripartite-type tricarboxylate transporter receptor subunit TctC
VFEQVGRQIGQPVVIESRLGAGGTMASAAVARSEPDGTTVLFTSSAYTITPLERLHREIVTALEPPEVKERIVKLGGEPTSLSPSEFDALLKAELGTNAVVVRASGLKAN